MGVELAVAAISAGASFVGSQRQAKAQKRQAAVSREIAAESRKAEQVRKRQQDLIAARNRRKARREAIIARADVLSSSINRGLSGTAQSSITQGAVGQIQTGLGQQVADINQNQELGSQIFQSNENIAQLREQSSAFAAQGQTGQAIAGLGGQIAANFGPITRIGNTLVGRGTGLFGNKNA